MVWLLIISLKVRGNQAVDDVGMCKSLNPGKNWITQLAAGTVIPVFRPLILAAWTGPIATVQYSSIIHNLRVHVHFTILVCVKIVYFFVFSCFRRIVLGLGIMIVN